MRGQDITEGQPYARRRTGGWLPEKVTVTGVTAGKAQWVNEYGERRPLPARGHPRPLAGSR